MALRGRAAQTETRERVLRPDGPLVGHVAQPCFLFAAALPMSHFSSLLGSRPHCRCALGMRLQHRDNGVLKHAELDGSGSRSEARQCEPAPVV